MATLFDYIHWRGNLTFSMAKFNNLDALILAELSYFTFDDVVSSDLEKRITIGTALKNLKTRQTNFADSEKLVEALQSSARFKDIDVFGYVNEVDEENYMQFSAITADIGQGNYFIVYRGTDNTLIGWRESLNMAVRTVPAQERALEYLNNIMSDVQGRFMVGGHSKGGNLAIYASTFCSKELQDRIDKVFDFDGPGFSKSIHGMEAYKNIKDRIKTIIPQSSVIGMLLEHETEYSIVTSSKSGFVQHDAFTWEVDTTDFTYAEHPTRSSEFINETIKSWISGLTPEERSEFIDALYGLFASSEIKTIDDFAKRIGRNSIAVIKEIRELDKPKRTMLFSAVSSLIGSARENIPIIVRAQEKTGDK